VASPADLPPSEPGFVLQAWHLVAGGVAALFTGVMTGKLQIRRTESDFEAMAKAWFAEKAREDEKHRNEIVAAIGKLEQSMLSTLTRIHAETGAGIQGAIRDIAAQYGDVKSDTRVIIRELDAIPERFKDVGEAVDTVAQGLDHLRRKVAAKDGSSS